MPRTVSPNDAFNAIAELKRREILVLLADRPRRIVGELIEELGLPQSAVSKHLAILRKAGLVAVEKDGQHRRYSLRARELKAVHAWTQQFEKFWSDHLDAIQVEAERRAREIKNQKR